MTPTSKNRLSLAIGIIVALIFLYMAMRDTSLTQIIACLSDANLAFIPLVALALLLQFWFKALRWELLLRPFARTTPRQVFPATVVGYLANLVFPLYLGEIVRIYLLGRQLSLNYTPVLATVLLERFFDFLSVLLIVGLVLVLDPLVPPALKIVGMAAGIISIALLILVGAYLRWTDALTRLALGMTSFLPGTAQQKIAEQMELLAVGLQSIRNVRLLPAIAIASMLQWGFMGLCIFFGMMGTGVDAPISAGFVVLALTVMGVTLPSSPGFFGTIQLCFILGLTPYGVDVSQAFAASLFFHLTIYVTGWSAGLYFMRRSGLDFTTLKKAATER
jgi:glycosyltransferase 2 family protein